MKKSELKEMLSMVRGELAAEKNCVNAFLGGTDKLRCELEKTKRALGTEVKQLRCRLEEAQEWTRIVEKDYYWVIRNEKATAKALRGDLEELKAGLVISQDAHNVTKNILRDTKVMLDSVVAAPPKKGFAQSILQSWRERNAERKLEAKRATKVYGTEHGSILF